MYIIYIFFILKIIIWKNDFVVRSFVIVLNLKRVELIKSTVKLCRPQQTVIIIRLGVSKSYTFSILQQCTEIRQALWFGYVFEWFDVLDRGVGSRLMVLVCSHHSHISPTLPEEEVGLKITLPATHSSVLTL